MSVMAGDSREQLVAELVALYPENDRPGWARYYRGKTKGELRHQIEAVRAHQQSKQKGQTVTDPIVKQITDKLYGPADSGPTPPDAELLANIIAACTKLQNATPAQLAAVRENLLDADAAVWEAVEDIEGSPREP